MISRWQDWLLAIAVLAVALAGAWLLIIAASAQRVMPPLQESEFSNELDEIDRQAVREAYRSYVIQLFSGWMQDPRDQPERAMTGIRKGRKAFIDSMNAINQRK